MAESPGARTTLEEMDGSEIREPGCYLHISSGLLARVFPEQLTNGHIDDVRPLGRVARLADSPHMPLTTLRLIAERGGYRVGF